MLPNVISYSALISTCEKGKQPKQALELYGTMQQQAMLPNVITYYALLQGFAATG